jgi:hypothetical protein
MPLSIGRVSEPSFCIHPRIESARLEKATFNELIYDTVTTSSSLHRVKELLKL